GKLTDSSWYIGLIHPGNTAAKRLADRHWHRRPIEDVNTLLECDRAFYERLQKSETHEAAPRRQVYRQTNAAQPARRRCAVNDRSEMPLVSCVMPTHNRRHFVPRAIEYFRRQKYPSR